MTLKHVLGGFLILSFVIGISGCKETPTSVGTSLLPSGDTPQLKVDTLFASGDSSAFAYVNSINNSRLFLGKTTDYEAWGMIDFAFPALPDSLAAMKIVGGAIQLRSMYVQGSASAPMSFTVYPLNYFSTNDSLSMDSLTLRSTLYYSATPVGQLLPTASGEVDSLRISISDTSILWQAVRSTSESSPFEGFLIRPTYSGNVRAYGSAALSSPYLPVLIVQYSDNGTIREVTYSSSSTRSIVSANPLAFPSGQKTAFVQNGYAHRAFFSFDLSSFGKATSVARANLELTLNPSLSSSPSGNSVDSLWAYFVAEDGSIITSITATTMPALSTTGRNKYVIPIPGFVQEWIKPGRLVHKILLAGSGESLTLDRIALYNHQATSVGGSDLRPRIVVTHLPTY